MLHNMQSTFAVMRWLGLCLDSVQGQGLSHGSGWSSQFRVVQTFLQTGLAHYKQAETQVFEHLKGGLPARRKVNESPPAILSTELSVHMKGTLYLAYLCVAHCSC